MPRLLSIGAEYRVIETLRGEQWLPSQRVKIMAQLPSFDLKTPFLRAEVLIVSGSHAGERKTISARLERVHRREVCNCPGKSYPHQRGDRDCNFKEDALCYCGECGKDCQVVEQHRPQAGQPERLELRSHCHEAPCFCDPELQQIYDPWRTT